VGARPGRGDAGSRELSRHGLLEFVNVHAIVVSPPEGPHQDRADVSE